MRGLVLRPEAQNDIAAAHNEVLLHSPHRAQNLLEAVDEGLRLIEEQPRLYAVRPEGVRRTNLKEFRSRSFTASTKLAKSRT